MANKKTIKKTAEIKNIQQLHEELAAKRADLLEARRGHGAGELTNPRVLTMTRKEIARLLTAIKAAKTHAKEDN